jgi:hypothetical protein
MTTNLSALVAEQHTADLRREAARQRAFLPAVAAAPSPSVSLRRAQPADAPALTILAALDEQPELSGEALLALVNGRAVAAMSLHDGRVVADPFVATADAVSMLRAHARRLLGRAPGRSRRRWRPRFA